MRTHEQSRVMHLPTNGEYDWPDYRAVETCPVCCTRAKPGGDALFWMMFQHLMQKTHDGAMAMKFVCRLVCTGCFKGVMDGTFIECSLGEDSQVRSVPIMKVIEEQGPVTWLRNGQGMCVLTDSKYENLDNRVIPNQPKVFLKIFKY